MTRGRSLAAALVLVLFVGDVARASASGDALVLPPAPGARTYVPAGGDSPDGDPLGGLLPAAPDSRAARAASAGAGAGAGDGAASYAALTSTLLGDGEGLEGDLPTAIAFTPDGATIVIAHEESMNLVLFDALTTTVTGVIALSGHPSDMALSSDGVHAVTANHADDTVSIVDLAAGVETGVVPVGSQPGIVRITPNGATAVVGNPGENSLSVIDIGSATELHRVFGMGFSSIVRLTGESGVTTAEFVDLVCPGDVTAVHSNAGADELDVVDLVTGAVTAVPCADFPFGMAVTQGGATVVVAHRLAARTLSILDVATRSITSTVTTSVDLDGRIAVNPGGTKAIASVLNGVIVIDLGTGLHGPVLSTASVDEILTTSDGLYGLCVGYRGSLVSFAGALVKDLNNQVACYQGAVSPVAARGAMVSSHNGEDLLVMTTNGAAGALVGKVPSGPPPEGDRARRVAVTPDGALAVMTDILSDTATIVNAQSGALVGIVPVGDRPSGVAITPDGSRAVVANLDSTFVSVIDLVTLGVTNVTTSTRNSEVAISPDGHYAYVSVVVADGIWRIDLDTLTLDGPKLPVGEMGSVFFGFQQNSGLALGHDGNVLAACNSFDDTVTLIDTASWTVFATVPVGDAPVRAVFTSDDVRLLVSNRDGGTISVITLAGAGSSVTSTLTAGTWPFEMAISADDGTVWVADFLDDDVRRIAITSGATAIVPLPDAPQGLALRDDGTRLDVATGNWSVTIGPGSKVVVNQSGDVTSIDTASATVVESVATGQPPAALARVPGGDAVLVPAPRADGCLRVDPDAGLFADLGGSLAGTTGLPPQLVGAGTLQPFAPTTLALHGFHPNRPVYVLIGLSVLGLPFKGGVLVPSPDIVVGPIPSGPLGAFSLTFPWLGPAPPGTQIVFQDWIADPSGPAGFVATNGLVATQP
ncbi:MAG: YncE family protein [Planctomycetes bacterium]|nr:YncE family protein [Planctomycetota bacterium]